MQCYPLLIVGISPRSGTNLLFYHLASSPSCIFPKTMFECNIFQTDSITNNQIRTLLEQQSWDKYKTQHLLLKTPISQNCDRLLEVYPNAKMIVIVRDGRRIVNSMYKSSISMENGLEPHMMFYKICAEYLKELLIQIPHLNVVKYEDLTSDPQYTINNVCNRLAITPPSKSAIEKVDQTLYGSSSVSIHNDWQWTQTSKPANFNTQPLKWSNDTQQQFDDICGEINKYYGY